ncbi:hypothetical protein SARC_06982 [Sphaeroforma arctica JP610]|uniref:Lipocalin/cytosolic fatty-acid binding domain-containing protein n=1 Tax=Sphaeroforma arctica JP610 TaxID=667725 RepID=A0A0L0FXJ3_9EUKA|nr:hypothetical protein SARC_06982 [Sphaeroforma arctica JP610]KNC80668.1 hypothetical protein SARC_06982 [Sphaeroforma arctica JP610]|eukprot:XP_014154570.1 hypothetical protein SARC_06982 [Sphaeroforma arctica JP610]
MLSSKFLSLVASLVLAIAQTPHAQPSPATPSDVFVVDLEDDSVGSGRPPSGVSIDGLPGVPENFNGAANGVGAGAPAGIDFAACVIEQEVVDPFDIDGYMGTWYEIATNDLVRNTFEQGCKCTTANYELFDNGTVQVKNTCIRDGEPYEIIGAATAEDPEKGAFTVSFGDDNLGAPSLGENYLILAQGNDAANDDAQYTVVGSVCNAIGWILSRSATMSEEAYAEAVAIFEERGYKPNSEAFNLQKSQDEDFCAPIQTDK